MCAQRHSHVLTFIVCDNAKVHQILVALAHSAPRLPCSDSDCHQLYGIRGNMARRRIRILLPHRDHFVWPFLARHTDRKKRMASTTTMSVRLCFGTQIRFKRNGQSTGPKPHTRLFYWPLQHTHRNDRIFSLLCRPSVARLSASLCSMLIHVSRRERSNAEWNDMHIKNDVPPIRILYADIDVVPLCHSEQSRAVR